MKIEISILMVSGWWLLSYLAHGFVVYPAMAVYELDPYSLFLRSSILDVSVLTAAVIAAGLMAGGAVLWKWWKK